METLDALTVLLPTEIYSIIIFSGIIYFILFFYRTKKWGKYSDFDKVVFSVILGGFVWYFFILPISIFLFIFNVFQKPGVIIPNDFLKYSSYSIYFILAFYLILWRLLKINNKPLGNNNTFLMFTKSLIVGIILFVALTDCALLVAFSYTTYQENFAFMVGSILILLPILFLFYFTFDKIFLKTSLLSFTEEKPFLDFAMLKNNKKLRIFIILMIPISALAGIYFLKPTTLLVDDRSNRLEIPRIETWEYRRNLTGDFDVEQDYTVTFRFIPWVKIKSNISLLDIYGKPYRTHPNYTFSGNYEVIINNSRWNTINVSLVGKKHEDNLPKIYTIEKKDLNESVQIWSIIFTNPYDMYIKIYEVDIAKDAQFKLVRYNITGLNFNKEALDETLKNQQNQEKITIKDVGVRHKSLNLNQSITLFFDKVNEH